MKSVIVTGANGFVGTWLVKELCSHDINIIAVVKSDKENVDELKLLPNVTIVTCELGNLHELSSKVQGDFDVFFHLAWAGSTGNVRADYNLQLQNVKWSVDAVSIAAQIGCRRFVGAGTLAEFDCGAYIPQNGSTPNDVTCYGSAKIAAHYMSKAIANSLGIDHIWAYLSNTYGVGNRTQNFVNFASKKMILGKSADFTLGEQYYDFVYVSDIAQALYLLGAKGVNNFAYYIGSTQVIKLKEYIMAIRDAIDPNITINFGAVPFNGVALPKDIFNCCQLVEDTGYCPKVPFDSGIRTTVEWLKAEIMENRV